MQIEKVKIKDLVEYEGNAKLHPQEQIDKIKKSIQEFGNNDPIAIDENNIIIEGHGRLQALEQLGYTEAEVIRLSHLSEDQKKAYILVHNKLNMDTGFDTEMLRDELDEIFTVDMADFGFDLPKVNCTEQSIKLYIKWEISNLLFKMSRDHKKHRWKL